MSTQVPANPVYTPQLAVLDRTIGVLFSGYSCSLVLYGFIFFRPSSFRRPSDPRTHLIPESYTYFNDYPRDPVLLKALVSTERTVVQAIPENRILGGARRVSVRRARSIRLH